MNDPNPVCTGSAGQSRPDSGAGPERPDPPSPVHGNSDRPLSRRLVGTMAVGAGAVVANLYYLQPLTATLADDFGTSRAVLGLTITLVQVGTATGLATVVPLGDLIERRRLLTTLLGVGVAGLLTMAFAPGPAVLASGALVVGLSGAGAQVIVPFAAHMAEGKGQGRVVGTVMSGLLMGILLSRTLSGLVADLLGWRAVFVLGALATGSVALLLRRELPVLRPDVQMAYPALLLSVLRQVREEPVLRLRMLYGALSFASFSVFWTGASFLLSSDPYNWSEAAIGAFALFGVAGALAAQAAGRLADRGLERRATGTFLLIMALSYGLIGWGGHSLPALVIGVILMDLGSQGTHITNQSVVYRLRPAERSRTNTAYMLSFMLGGACGSASCALVFDMTSWTGVCVLGAALPAAAWLIWLLEGRVAE
ncbi:MAG: hypothetical protein QG608_3706 [Actinomycetota bacterium]|nr:hypothetical protein [Actinomycetota bacterium]